MGEGYDGVAPSVIVIDGTLCSAGLLISVDYWQAYEFLV